MHPNVVIVMAISALGVVPMTHFIIEAGDRATRDRAEGKQRGPRSVVRSILTRTADLPVGLLLRPVRQRAF